MLINFQGNPQPLDLHRLVNRRSIDKVAPREAKRQEKRGRISESIELRDGPRLPRA